MGSRALARLLHLFGWQVLEVMALVEPNRIATDKYFVPHEVYPMQWLGGRCPQCWLQVLPALCAWHVLRPV